MFRVAKALRARPALGQRRPPSRRRPQREGGAHGACPLLTWGRLRPLGGDRRRGTVRLLRAAKMRPKTLGSDAGGSVPAAGEDHKEPMHKPHAL